jgi:uncharacterized pyridoxamine 5'-phosphate oxidase family protein
VDGTKPRVRPFGTALLYEDKIYILTAKNKNVSKQIEKNNEFEISATVGDEWIRISGTLAEDNRTEVHEAILNKYSHLRASYTVSGENTNTLYIQSAKVKFESFSKEPVEFEI